MSVKSPPLGQRFTKTYIHRMAEQAQLRVSIHNPGNGSRYTFYDQRDRTEAFPLFLAITGSEAGAFISGFIAGRNREHIK